MGTRGVLERMLMRLRRSLVRLLGWIAGRRPEVWEADVTSLVEQTPPQDWVERVRRGAPGLLEPSVRDRVRPEPRRPTPAVARWAPPPEAPEDLPPRVAGGPALRGPVTRKLLARPRARGRVAVPVDAHEEPAAVRAREQDGAAPEIQAHERRIGRAAARPQPAAAPLEDPPELGAVKPHVVPGPLERPLYAEAADERLPWPAVDSWEDAREGRSIRVPAPTPQRVEAGRPIVASLRGTASVSSPGPVSARPELHPWPTLPVPGEAGRDDVEAALRASARARRLEREQTSL